MRIHVEDLPMTKGSQWWPGGPREDLRGLWVPPTSCLAGHKKNSPWGGTGSNEVPRAETEASRELILQVVP